MNLNEPEEVHTEGGIKDGVVSGVLLVGSVRRVAGRRHPARISGSVDTSRRASRRVYYCSLLTFCLNIISTLRYANPISLNVSEACCDTNRPARTTSQEA